METRPSSAPINPPNSHSSCSCPLVQVDLVDRYPCFEHASGRFLWPRASPQPLPRSPRTWIPGHGPDGCTHSSFSCRGQTCRAPRWVWQVGVSNARCHVSSCLTSPTSATCPPLSGPYIEQRPFGAPRAFLPRGHFVFNHTVEGRR